MISDVLSDAVIEIEDYERTLPRSYEGIKTELAQVKLVMDVMRRFLDIPVPDAQLAAAIRNLDTSELKAVLERPPSLTT